MRERSLEDEVFEELREGEGEFCHFSAYDSAAEVLVLSLLSLLFSLFLCFFFFSFVLILFSLILFLFSFAFHLKRYTDGFFLLLFPLLSPQLFLFFSFSYSLAYHFFLFFPSSPPPSSNSLVGLILYRFL